MDKHLTVHPTEGVDSLELFLIARHHPVGPRLYIYRNGQRSIETLKSLKLAKPFNIKYRTENKTLL